MYILCRHSHAEVTEAIQYLWLSLLMTESFARKFYARYAVQINLYLNKHDPLSAGDLCWMVCHFPPPLPATQSVKELNWNVCETLIDGCIICDVLKQEYHARHNNLQWCLSCNQGKLKRATQTLLTTTVPGSHYCGMQVLITWANQELTDACHGHTTLQDLDRRVHCLLYTGERHHSRQSLQPQQHSSLYTRTEWKSPQSQPHSLMYISTTLLPYIPGGWGTGGKGIEGGLRGREGAYP